MVRFRIRRAGAFLQRHWIIIAFLTALIAWIMTPGALERFFVYFPARTLDYQPSQFGMQHQELHLRTEDGEMLHAWFIPKDGARTTLLIFHGNAGNISHRLPWFQMLRELDVNILAPDYRGYGKSTGSPHEQGLYLDARAARAWWQAERGKSGEKLVLLGESLGGAVAVHLAAESPAAGLILQSAFSSAWDMAKTILPIGLLQPLARVEFDSIGKVKRISCPKLHIHGSQDEIVPLRLGKKLFEAAPEPKEYYEVPGAGHNDLPWVGGTAYIERLRRFLQTL